MSPPFDNQSGWKVAVLKARYKIFIKILTKERKICTLISVAATGCVDTIPRRFYTQH